MKLASRPSILTEFKAYNAAPGGGATERIAIPLHHAEVDLPPSELEGILITGDLQFYHDKNVPAEDRILMGYVIAEEIHELCENGLLPPPHRLGVMLVGDMYAEPCLTKRGGSGDVEDIWHTFANHFRWIAGVAGNHDLYEGQAKFPSSFRKRENIHALHYDTVELDGLTIGGISGISGNPRKIWRYSDHEFQSGISEMLRSHLDCLLLHQGPVGPEKSMRGAQMINEALGSAAHQPDIVAFGHCHWSQPDAMQNGMQLLNSDGRAILLTRPEVEVKL